jgi:hypothetical protein
VLFFDTSFADLVVQMAPKLPSSSTTSPSPTAPHARNRTLQGLVAYEDFIAQADDDFAWAEFDENTACGLLLHLRHHRQSEGRALFAPLERAAHPGGAAGGCAWACGPDTVLPVVPMFHANAWGSPFSAR